MSKPPAPPARPSLKKFPVRRLLSLAATEKRNLILGTICLALASGMSLVYPQAIRVIIDGALESKDRAAIDRTALWMVAVFAVQGVAMALRYVLFTISGERIVARLREQLYRSLVSPEIGFFDERRTGELVSRLASDTTVLQNTVSANVSMVLRNLAAAVGGIALLLWTSPTLTLLMLAVVPPVAAAAVLYGKRVRTLSKSLQDSLAASSEVAEETLSGIRTVRSFAAEETEAGRYRTAIDRTFQLARQRAVVAGSFFGGASFFAYAAAAVVLWYGSRLVMDGELTVGSLTSFLMYTLIVAFSLGALGELWTDFMKAIGAGERVFELLDRAPAIPTNGGRTLPAVRGDVAFEDVRFSYPTRADVPVLRGIDLHVRPGELVAVVGSSGAGKSTLAALLGRLYDPKEGRILIDGAPLSELDPSWLRRQIGVVSQEPILFSTTVADNIRYGRTDATDAEVEQAARAANAHDFVSRFPEGYKTMVGERGIQLSGGQKQRVAIARAVLKDPRILVLDEATSALDAESEHLVKEALDRLLVGRTTLVIAHRLSTVADADRVVVLDGGRIVQSGAHQELLREEGLYKRLVERQFVAA